MPFNFSESVQALDQTSVVSIYNFLINISLGISKEYNKENYGAEEMFEYLADELERLENAELTKLKNIFPNCDRFTSPLSGMNFALHVLSDHAIKQKTLSNSSVEKPKQNLIDVSMTSLVDRGSLPKFNLEKFFKTQLVGKDFRQKRKEMISKGLNVHFEKKNIIHKQNKHLDELINFIQTYFVEHDDIAHLLMFFGVIVQEILQRFDNELTQAAITEIYDNKKGVYASDTFQALDKVQQDELKTELDKIIKKAFPKEKVNHEDIDEELPLLPKEEEGNPSCCAPSCNIM